MPTTTTTASRLALSRVFRRDAHRRAARTADLLDRIVDRDVRLVRDLPVHLRSRHVDKLAAMVMLAQAYRHYANGWITRRELRRRSHVTFGVLAQFICD